MLFTSASGADSHRLVVLDIGRWPNNRPGSDRHQLLLVGIASGAVLARADLESNTSLAVSRDGETVAAIAWLRGDPPNQREIRLSFYRAADLSLVQSGRLPDALPRRQYQQGAAADIQFSPDGQEIVLCGLVGRGNVDQATTVVTRVKRELDDSGFFKAESAATLHPCRSVDFVSLAAWPLAQLLDHTFTLLHTVDLDRGQILGSVAVGDPPPDAFDQTSRENASMQSILRARNKGVFIPGDHRYAYYLPSSISNPPGLPGPLPEAALLKKIDLSADPPQVIAKGPKGDPDLRARIAAVSESAGAIYVVEERRNPQFTYEPSRWVKVFSARDLSFQQRIELPLADCQSLAVSRDGSRLYALDPENARLAVLETASARVLKVLDVGNYPLLMVAVADGRAH
jgi:hypothetical protein